MGKKGQATVEFALAVLLLFTLLFGIIDLAFMFYVNMTMQHAVRAGARSVVVGGNDLRNALGTKIAASANGLCTEEEVKKALTVSVLTPTDKVNFSNYTTTPVADTGVDGDIIVVSLTYAWPLLTPVFKALPAFADGKYTFTVRATMKNEPWGAK